MKFLVNAQLPRRFASWLKEAWHDALHTLDLPKKNLTPDNELIARANLSGIEAAFAAGMFVEITREALVVHE